MTIFEFTKSLDPQIEVVRSYAEKVNLGNYQSADFFSSAKAQCQFSKAQETSEMLYQFCRDEVKRAIYEHRNGKTEPVKAESSVDPDLCSLCNGHPEVPPCHACNGTGKFVPPSPAEVTAAKQSIAKRVEDAVKDNAARHEEPGKVVDIMDSLKASIAEAKAKPSRRSKMPADQVAMLRALEAGEVPVPTAPVTDARGNAYVATDDDLPSMTPPTQTNRMIEIVDRLRRYANVSPGRAKTVIRYFRQSFTGQEEFKECPENEPMLRLLSGIVSLVKAKDADAMTIMSTPTAMGQSCAESWRKLQDGIAQASWTPEVAESVRDLAIRRYPVLPCDALDLLGTADDPMGRIKALEMLP